MPAWITDLIPVAPWLAALALAVWVGAMIVRKFGPFVVKLVHFIDDVAGEPARPGVPARPGLMERFATVEEKQDEQGIALAEQGAAIAVVQHEVTTNHGSSLKDAVKGVDTKVHGLSDRVEGIEKHLKEKP